MKARQSRQVSLIRRMIVVSLLFSLFVIGTVSYNVLGGTRFFQTRSYKEWQLSADARTVVAALSYLLEPEPDVDPSSPSGTLDSKKFVIGVQIHSCTKA